MSDGERLAERMATRAGRTVTVMTAEDVPLELPVHPAAAVFPMLSDDELRDLAEDIKANGQILPIVLDKTGAIVDGRNRFAACKLAGVEPTFITFDGDDEAVVAYILSLNVYRRNMTEGQKAIATVRAIGPCKLHESRGAAAGAVRASGLEQARVSQGLVIVEWAPELADAVMAKTRPFSKAFEEARAIRAAQQDREETAATERVELVRVQMADADLHLMVVEGRLSLGDAIAVLDKREREAREQRQRKTRQFMDGATLLWGSLFGTPEHIVETWLPDDAAVQMNGSSSHLRTANGLRELAGLIAEAAEAVERHGGTLP